MFKPSQHTEEKPGALNLFKTSKRCGKCSTIFDTKVPGYKKHRFYGLVCHECSKPKDKDKS